MESRALMNLFHSSVEAAVTEDTRRRRNHSVVALSKKMATMTKSMERKEQ